MVDRDGRSWLPLHVLDLHSKGIIFPHVDSLKFSGDVVAGLSLYSDSVCTFDLQHPSKRGEDGEEDGDVHQDPQNQMVSDDDFRPSRVRVYLPRRSFYVTSGDIRNTYAHGIRDAGASQIRRRHCVGIRLNCRIIVLAVVSLFVWCWIAFAASTSFCSHSYLCLLTFGRFVLVFALLVVAQTETHNTFSTHLLKYRRSAASVSCTGMLCQHSQDQSGGDQANQF